MPALQTTPQRLPRHLVLYDGLCGFCDASVQWLLAHDPDGRLSFAALEDETAQAILARHPEVPEGLDSLILVESDGDTERIHWRSTAVFRLCRQLPGAWRVFSWFSVLPTFLTDLGYRFIARIRYSIWGRRESCRVPTPAERARFLP